MICFFPALVAALVLLYYPTFHNPPRSDYWSAFYVFQQVDASPSPWGWTVILTFDLWQHGTYRPLSHLVPYLEHRLFSPHFIWNHILNFAAYCLSIVLLFFLARRLSLDAVVTLLFLTVFSFLFTHFDILAWTFQLFSILGFCFFLSGFLLYLGYLKSGRRPALLVTGILFLFGMFLSEAYALWPLAVLLLPLAFSGSGSGTFRKPVMVMLTVVYLVYLGGFLLHRSAASPTGPVPLPALGQVLLGLSLSFFNLFYNGILVNLCPSLGLPLYYNDNVNLGGILLNLGNRLEAVGFWAGAGVLVLVGTGLWLVAREGRRRELWLLLMFLFLYLSNFLVVAVARLTTNGPIYPLSQFRYQYVPNALLALVAAAVFGRLITLKSRGKFLLIIVLLPVVVVNISASRRQLDDLGERLAPLRAVLDNIQQGLQEGWISEQETLFISESVTERLPTPSWNRGMARFMEGNLQWFFPAQELGKFTMSPARATWTVTTESLPAVRRAVLAGQ